MFKIAFFAVALMASTVQGNVLTDGITTLGYAAFKEALTSVGKSEEYADCMVKILKITGTTNDMFDMRSFLDPEKLIDKLESKARFANFVCSNGGFVLLGGMFIVFLAAICCCCSKACCSDKQPMLIAMPSTIPLPMPFDREISYERMNKV